MRLPPRAAHWLGVLAAMALIAALPGCDSGDDAPPVLEQGDTYTETIAGTWQRINPLFVSGNPVDADISALVFSGLTRMTEDGTVAGDLAEGWEVSDNGRRYTFTLREGLRWHDGEALTAADVVYTIDQIVDPEFLGDPVLAELWRPVEVRTPDNRTVELVIEDPFAPFLSRATTVGILPRHLLRGLSAGDLFDAPFNSHPVGSGPYAIEQVAPREVRLAVYAGYHFGVAPIERVQLRFEGDPVSAAGLVGNGADATYLAGAAGETSLIAVAEEEGAEATAVQQTAYWALYLNNLRLPFDEPEIRRAISLAINREQIVDEVLGGAGVASSSPVPPGNWAYNGDSDVVTADPQAARGILEGAGFAPGPGTGILTRDGTELAFTIRTDNDPIRLAIAEAIRTQLNAIGMRVTVASTSFAVLRRDFLQPRRYDAALAAWEQGPDPDPYPGWHSSQTGPDGLNLANYGDRVTDELITSARQSVDRGTRIELYRQWQEKWQELTPSVVVAYPLDYYLRVGGEEDPVPSSVSEPAERFGSIIEWDR